MYKLSSRSFGIYKKLSQFREESLSNKLVTGKQNPVGILGVLNRHYQWNMPGVSREQANKHALTAAELPKLNSSSCATIACNLDADTQENSEQNCVKSQTIQKSFIYAVCSVLPYMENFAKLWFCAIIKTKHRQFGILFDILNRFWRRSNIKTDKEKRGGGGLYETGFCPY